MLLLIRVANAGPGRGLLPWVWIAGSPLTFLWLACGPLGAERLRRQSQRLDDRSAPRFGGATLPDDEDPLFIVDCQLRPSCHTGSVGVVRPLNLLPAAAMSGW